MFYLVVSRIRLCQVCNIGLNCHAATLASAVTMDEMDHVYVPSHCLDNDDNKQMKIYSDGLFIYAVAHIIMHGC